jgi:hypothetical protein
MRRVGVLLAASLLSCGTAGGFEAAAECQIRREPGSMVATVTGVTVTVRATGAVEGTTSVRVDLVDADEVVASTTVEIGPLDAGDRRVIETSFADTPEGGWPVQPDARCVVADDDRYLAAG